MAKSKKWQVNYEIISELGEGGNAKVYQVKSKDDGQEYALKDLVAGGREKKGRFIDEIRVIDDNYKYVKGLIPIIEISEEE
jgi:serine/threonine protein kinase